ncbi:MAG: hypothetical protein H6P98_1210, partial [Candidatus Aminicenantes bacterium]|nr:hypothetical protein [Candidatus Aminicenantes bacterium]
MTKNACRRKWGLIILLLFAGRASCLRAQDVRVPVEVQFDLFSKILITGSSIRAIIGPPSMPPKLFGICYIGFQ